MIQVEPTIQSEVDAKLKALGLRIRAQRISRGWTLREMAARLFCSVNTYRAIEAGRPTSSVGLLAQTLWLIGEIDSLDQVVSVPVSGSVKGRARKSLKQALPGKISESERDF